jgi:hypothetical protein
MVYPLSGGAQVAHEGRISVPGAACTLRYPPVVPGLVGAVKCVA